MGTAFDGLMTSLEAMDASGLNHPIWLEDIQTTSGIAIPTHKSVVRGDTGQSLGVVGLSYKPLQNADAFSFLDSLVSDGELRYDTAGGLGQGERVWMLAKLPSTVRIAGSDDVVEKYLLLDNSHNGLTSLRVFFTPIRVVCWNTLTEARRAASRQGVTIRHTGDMSTKLAEARRVLGLADSYYTAFGEQANAMASVQMNSAAVASYFASVFPAPADPEKSKRAANTAKDTWAALTSLYETGKGTDIPEVRGTLWAAYNAVTEFCDHSKESSRDAKLSLEQAAENRLVSNWFGTGSFTKGTAFEEALKVLVERN
jgi:phage/plasmid-like protein (TIGR03299 family)